MNARRYETALAKVRSICLALPESREVEAWGLPTFRAGKKMFAALSRVSDAELVLGMKVGHERQEELMEDSRFFPTPYAAHQGWVSLRLEGKPDWAEVTALLREAYRQVALQRMLKALDAEG